jgi:altronate dehydratase large subunit
MIDGNTKIRMYQRANGTVGIRDHLVVISTVCCANHGAESVASKVEGAVHLTHAAGCGQLGVDAAQTLRILENTGAHPNVGAALVVGLGCEQNNAHELAKKIAETGKPVASLTIQESGGTMATIEKGISLCQKLMTEKSAQAHRVPLAVSELTIGLECGGSDFTSGIAANPVVGLVADRFIDSGAGAVFGETTEVIGAEHHLAGRAVDEQVRGFILDRVREVEKGAEAMLVDIRGSQPSPGNIAGGLTTIAEKSLGAICKAGSRPIVDGVAYGQSVRKRGLTFMDTPGQDLVSLGGIVAGGAHLVLFTTGRGTPLGNAVAPVIKITANKEALMGMAENFDVDLSPILADEMSLEQGADLITSLTLEAAEGKRVQAEILGHREFGFHAIGPTL